MLSLQHGGALNKRAVLTISLLLLIFASVAVESQADQRLTVIASIHPLSDIIKNIGKDRINSAALLPPGASPHIFEPTPSTMRTIRQAKIFFKIGAGLELWADRIIKSASAENLRVVDLSETMPLLYSTHNHKSKAGHKNNGSHPDPHYWLDPVLCIRIVDKIAEGLSSIDPASKAYYMKNAASYKKELGELNKEIKSRVDGFSHREYVTFHSAWRYFSERYNLKILGVIEDAPGREPTPKNISNIISSLKKSNAKVVFAEPQFNPKIAAAIAKEAGASVIFLDPIGSPKDSRTNTYINLMKFNIGQMQQGMK